MYDLGGNMPFFHLDKEKCKKDGICSAVCVTGIIKNDDERSPYIDEKNAYKCISCGLCVAFCPHEACYVENLDTSQFSKVNRDTLAAPEQLDTFLKTRRSVRVFRKNTVNEETLNKIMDNVRYAPSAKNTHNNRWIITKSREETVKLGDLVAQYMQEHISEVPEEHALHYKLLCLYQFFQIIMTGKQKTAALHLLILNCLLMLIILAAYGLVILQVWQEYINH